MEVVPRPDRQTRRYGLEEPRGFKVVPRRWVVERTFAWISHNRRMSRDHERRCGPGEAFVYPAISRLMGQAFGSLLTLFIQSHERVVES